MLPLVRLPFPSPSGGLWALGRVWERRLYARRCRLDSSSSRFRFLAAVLRWRRRRCLGIRSSRALPCLDGASLRRRRRAHGGGFPQVDPLFRSLWTVACRQVSLLVFCSVDLGQAVGFVDVGGWIWLGFPSATAAVDGECGSGSWRSWGAAPVDGQPPMASFLLQL